VASAGRNQAERAQPVDELERTSLGQLRAIDDLLSVDSPSIKLSMNASSRPMAAGGPRFVGERRGTLAGHRTAHVAATQRFARRSQVQESAHAGRSSSSLSRREQPEMIAALETLRTGEKVVDRLGLVNVSTCPRPRPQLRSSQRTSSPSTAASSSALVGLRHRNRGARPASIGSTLPTSHDATETLGGGQSRSTTGSGCVAGVSRRIRRVPARGSRAVASTRLAVDLSRPLACHERYRGRSNSVGLGKSCVERVPTGQLAVVLLLRLDELGRMPKGTSSCTASAADGVVRWSAGERYRRCFRNGTLEHHGDLTAALLQTA
jgi:hypothetical protein